MILSPSLSDVHRPPFTLRPLHRLPRTPSSTSHGNKDASSPASGPRTPDQTVFLNGSCSVISFWNARFQTLGFDIHLFCFSFLSAGS
ncbi:hypothetical protein ACJZ2D_012067 [Fusarium nematophilum]